MGSIYHGPLVHIPKVTISVQSALEVRSSYLYMLMLYDCYDAAARPISVLSYRLYVLLSVAYMLKGYTPATC